MAVGGVVPGFVLLALLASLLRAVSIVVDEALLADYVEATPALVVTSMTISAALGLPWVFGGAVDLRPTPGALAVLAAQAAVYPVALWCYFAALDRSESTLVSPLATATPVVTVCLAYLFLGERLAFPGYLGVGAVVAGTGLLSATRAEGRLSLDGAVALMAAAVVLWGLDAALTDYVLDDVGEATAYAWKYGLAAAASAALLLRADVRRSLGRLVRRPAGGSLAVVTELVNAGGLAAGIAAYAVGPASLVAPLATLMAVFVFLVHAGLALVGARVGAGSPFDGWRRKLAATALVAAGVALVGVR